MVSETVENPIRDHRAMQAMRAFQRAMRPCQDKISRVALPGGEIVVDAYISFPIISTSRMLATTTLEMSAGGRDLRNTDLWEKVVAETPQIISSLYAIYGRVRAMREVMRLSHARSLAALLGGEQYNVEQSIKKFEESGHVYNGKVLCAHVDSPVIPADILMTWYYGGVGNVSFENR